MKIIKNDFDSRPQLWVKIVLYNTKLTSRMLYIGSIEKSNFDAGRTKKNRSDNSNAAANFFHVRDICYANKELGIKWDFSVPQWDKIYSSVHIYSAFIVLKSSSIKCKLNGTLLQTKFGIPNRSQNTHTYIHRICRFQPDSGEVFTFLDRQLTYKILSSLIWGQTTKSSHFNLTKLK